MKLINRLSMFILVMCFGIGVSANSLVSEVSAEESMTVNDVGESIDVEYEYLDIMAAAVQQDVPLNDMFMPNTQQVKQAESVPVESPDNKMRQQVKQAEGVPAESPDNTMRQQVKQAEGVPVESPDNMMRQQVLQVEDGLRKQVDDMDKLAVAATQSSKAVAENDRTIDVPGDPAEKDDEVQDGVSMQTDNGSGMIVGEQVEKGNMKTIQHVSDNVADTRTTCLKLQI